MVEHALVRLRVTAGLARDLGRVVARRDAVDLDVVLGELVAVGLGKAGKAMLGGRVGRRPLASQVGEERTDVDDLAAALRDHALRGLVAQLEGGGEIDVDHGIPLRSAEVEYLRHLADAGAVHQDVERAEPLHASGDDLRAGTGRRDVYLQELVAAARGLDHLSGRAVVVHDAGDEDVGTALGERQSERLAKSRIAAGDDAVSALEGEEIHGEICDAHRGVSPLLRISRSRRRVTHRSWRRPRQPAAVATHRAVCGTCTVWPVRPPGAAAPAARRYLPGNGDSAYESGSPRVAR